MRSPINTHMHRQSKGIHTIKFTPKVRRTETVVLPGTVTVQSGRGGSLRVMAH